MQTTTQFNEGYHFRSGFPTNLVKRHACNPDDADLFRDLWLFVICKSMSRLELQEMLEEKKPPLAQFSGEIRTLSLLLKHKQYHQTTIEKRQPNETTCNVRYIYLLFRA